MIISEDYWGKGIATQAVKAGFTYEGDNRNPAVFFFPVIFSGLFLCIGKSVIGDPEQLRMFSDSCNIFGGCLGTVPAPFLNKICGFF